MSITDLRVHGEIRKSQVNAINGTVATFKTSPVEVTLRSMIGQFHTVIEAFTINGITDQLKVVNRKVVNTNWDHLGEVNFPQVNRIKIDMLIEVDYPAFQFSFKRVPGIFYQIFIFSPNDSPSKVFPIHLRNFSQVSSHDIQIFHNFLPSFPHFPDSKGQWCYKLVCINLQV